MRRRKTQIRDPRVGLTLTLAILITSTPSPIAHVIWTQLNQADRRAA